MQQVSDLVIISDLHLAAERDKGLFRTDLALEAFLNGLAAEPHGITLVLAGDVFDYLVTNDGARAFDLAQAPARTTEILDCHKEVFDALTAFAQTKRHQLIILGGNHDPEVAATAVQRVIETRLKLPADHRPPCWLVNGEAACLKVGQASVIIEHGDLYDPWNRVDRASLGLAVRRASRGLNKHASYEPPPGSKLVVDYAATVREQFPWLDSLKPEREAVIPLLCSFLGWSKSKDLLRALPLWVAAKKESAEMKLLRTLDPAKLVRGNAAADARHTAFLQWLAAEQGSGIRGANETKNLEKLRKKLQPVAADDGFFEIAAMDEQIEAVTLLLAHGADLVVHGHTHAAKAYPVNHGLYLNSGTWGQLLQLPSNQAAEDDWRQFLTALQCGQDHSQPRATFVRVTDDPSHDATTAALLKWKDGTAHPLASYSFSNRESGWKAIDGVVL